MASETFYTDHWKHIEEERIARYEQMFQWREGNAALLEPAALAEGLAVLDFGAGPGFMALAIADIVGPSGQVHGVDLNARFVADATRRAAGRPNVAFHHVEGTAIPLPDAAVDRAICKNVLEYVPDLDATLDEIKRVLAPGGRIHIIDSDWGFVVVEPWDKAAVERFFAAAAPAFKEPHIGRKAPGLLARHGFQDVQTHIHTFADRDGRALSVLRNMVSYIEVGGGMPQAEANALLDAAEQAIATGEYLFVLPQFLVTAEKR